MVLGKLPVPGCPTCLDYSRARAYCTAVGAGGGCLDTFSLIYHFSFLSPSLWETARYRLKYCLKGPLSPKTTNQPTPKQKIIRFANRVDPDEVAHNEPPHQAQPCVACCL